MAMRNPASSSEPSHPQAAPVRKPWKSLWLPILTLLCSVVLLVIAWRIATRPTLGPGSRVPPEQRQAFFDHEVRPHLEQYSQRNQEAVTRAADHINASIDGYRQGIPAFVEDITSWRTRFGVIGRGSLDLWVKGREKWQEIWREHPATAAMGTAIVGGALPLALSISDPATAHRVQQYVSAIFEKHLFSDKDMAALIEATLQQFRDDLTASQNRLHADISAAWQSKVYAQGKLDLARVVAQVDQHVQMYSQTIATDSVTLGVVAEVAGNALGDAAAALVVKYLLPRVATALAVSAATTTAASGGATATGVAAGGAAGTAVVPGGGTVVGIAVGIVVGVAADWWMSKQLEQKLTAECEQLLSHVRDQILVGSHEAPGLKQVFIDSIALLQKAEESALHASLAEVAQ